MLVCRYFIEKPQNDSKVNKTEDNKTNTQDKKNEIALKTRLLKLNYPQICIVHKNWIRKLCAFGLGTV